MDLADVPVVDAHCHLIFPAYHEHDLAKVLCLSLEDLPEDQVTASLLYNKVLGELAYRWWGDPARADEVPAERERRMREDYEGHVRDLLDDVRLDGMVVDLGYKPASVPLEEFERVVPARVAYLFRVESVLDVLWDERPPFPDAEETLRDAVDQALEGRHVGLKTIIGYRTGLDIRRPGREEARDAWSRSNEKVVRDYFTWVALEKCVEHGCPLQVHTSFGESNIDLRNNDPLHLKGLLEREEARKVPIVLVHGGYPYSFEAGYMAAMYPNVYVDLSEGIPWVALETGAILRKVLSIAPLNKVMFGSDGFIVPEIAWVAARMMKGSLARVLSEMVRDRFVTARRAEEIAADVLGRTARDLFLL